MKILEQVEKHGHITLYLIFQKVLFLILGWLKIGCSVLYRYLEFCYAGHFRNFTLANVLCACKSLRDVSLISLLGCLEHSYFIKAKSGCYLSWSWMSGKVSKSATAGLAKAVKFTSDLDQITRKKAQLTFY